MPDERKHVRRRRQLPTTSAAGDSGRYRAVAVIVHPVPLNNLIRKSTIGIGAVAFE